MEKKSGFNRRDFLKIIGAGTGAAATGCASELPEKLIPYVVQPDEIIPGVSTWYAATCNECDAGCGTLIRTREGRAVKVEGNLEHPVNKGALCSRGQSSIQGHYDPDRIREPLKRDVGGSFKPISWKEALDLLAEAISTSSTEGKKSAFVSDPKTGSLKSLIWDFTSRIRGASYYEYAVLGRSRFDASVKNVFGPGFEGHYDFAKADTIVNFGADFLGTWISPVEFAKGFASRRVPDRKGKISHFSQIEPRLSQTGANADRWIKCAPGTEARLALAVAASVLKRKKSKGRVGAQAGRILKGIIGKQTEVSLLKGSGVSKKNLEEISLKLSKSSSPLVVADDDQGGSALSICHLLNAYLGSFGSAFTLKPSKRSYGKDMYALVSDMQKNAAAYGVLIFSNVNPAYSLPASSGFKKSVSEAGFVVSIATQLDETSRLANLVLPLSTSFESWGDNEPQPGVYGLNQPSMQPLYKTQSLGDTLLALLANPNLDKPLEDVSSFEDYIKARWKKRSGVKNFEPYWLKVVQRGGDWSKKVKATSSVTLRKPRLAKRNLIAEAPAEAVLLAFPTVNFGDGSAANRPWAQEIPDPISTVVWGSWAEMHPALAKKHGLEHGDVAQVVTPAGSIEAPVFVTENVFPNVVAVPIGQGHQNLGRYANGVGANPLKLLAAAAKREDLSFVLSRVDLRKSHAHEELVATQGHDSQEKRGFLRTITDKELVHDSSKHPEKEHSAHGEHADSHDNHGLEFHHHDLHALGPQNPPKQMYRQMEHVQYRWGMSIDLAKCTGCSACVTACYAENNVAVVGKEFCAQGREMSWIRINRYLDGNDKQPVTGFQPMMCQHCGNAPCEPVCPVYATYHSDEGLNTMVYNRCVGTRYCGNNCSYKVRRFNWFDYDWPEPLTWQLNPDVNVRTVGVMEKCSFCIQRIREGENNAKNRGSEVQDGDIMPACASGCPTEAITFGNLKDSKSEVAKLSKSERVYRVLDAELNTQPGVMYLAKVTHEE